MTQPDSPEELKEKLAAIEHQRWSDWQKWCNAVIREHIDSPKATEARLKLWDEQIATPYKDLKEYEKDSDREQVERYWPLVEEYYTNKFLEIVGERPEMQEGFEFPCRFCGFDPDKLLKRIKLL